MANLPAIVRVFLVCPGLGHINRGYESFTRECFDSLKADSRLDIFLYKGAGPDGDREQAIWNLRRTSRVARIANFFADPRHDAYYIEQATFTASLLPRILFHKPDVIFFSDPAIGHLLWRFRRATRSSFKLLLSNGGPTGPAGFPRIDHVHQVSPIYFDESAAAGRNSESQSLIPYGFTIEDPEHARRPNTSERRILRTRLNLPVDRQIILSIGVINRSHKRMDYLVTELGMLPDPRPFLLVLGMKDDESPGVIALADELLGKDGYAFITVKNDAVAEYLRCADVFVLASLKEGFSRALGEAYAAGLPCLATDAAHARFVMGTRGLYGDFSKRGILSHLVIKALQQATNSQSSFDQQIEAFQRLSWQRLAPIYADMIVGCAGISETTQSPTVSAFGMTTCV